MELYETPVIEDVFAEEGGVDPFSASKNPPRDIAAERIAYQDALGLDSSAVARGEITREPRGMVGEFASGVARGFYNAGRSVLNTAEELQKASGNEIGAALGPGRLVSRMDAYEQFNQGGILGNNTRKTPGQTASAYIGEQMPIIIAFFSLLILSFVIIRKGRTRNETPAKIEAGRQLSREYAAKIRARQTPQERPQENPHTELHEISSAPLTGNLLLLSQMRKRAEQGDVDSQFALGVAYGKGDGVPLDSNEAEKWYRLAAEQGDAVAQSRLGLAYYDGEGVPQDFAQAYAWLNLAANRGDAGAECFRSDVQKKMTPAQIQDGQRLSREYAAKFGPK